MKPIGGYFELELPDIRKNFPHALCPALNSGRHALEYILWQLGKSGQVIYLPYYTCDVVLEPLKRVGIQYQFYHIDDNLEIKDMPHLPDGHYLIVNNYFGIKDEYIIRLHHKFGSKMIVDNAQAYFMEGLQGMRAFYSPRKFVGIPDGGFACTPKERELELPQDFSTNRSSHILRRIDSGAASGYQEFKENSYKLSEEPMKMMSKLTYRILSSIDFDEIIYRRKRNFEYLHQVLGATNMLDIPDVKNFVCPLVYPYRTHDSKLRAKLISNNIFVATYWPNVLRWCNPDSIEYILTQEIIPIPIDQRYGKKEMDFIISMIKADAEL